MSVSVQFCPDRVRGVQHCLAVFSSIQHRPAVFCCFNGAQLFNSVRECSTASGMSEVFNLVRYCSAVSNRVQQCSAVYQTFAMRILVALEFFPVDLHTLVEFLAILFLPCLACAELAIVRSYFYFLLFLVSCTGSSL